MKRTLVCLLVLLLIGCAGESDPTEAESVGEAATNTPVVEAAPTSSPVPTATAAPTATPVPTETPLPEPTAVPPTPTEIPPTATPEPEPLYSEETIGGRAVHIYLPPEGEGPFPTLLFIGNRTPAQYARFAEEFQSRGYAVVLLYASAGRAGVEQSFCTLGWMNGEAEAYGMDMARVVTVGELATGWIAETVALSDDPARFLANCDYTLPEDYRVSAGASWWATHMGRMEETALCMEWLPHQSAVGGWFGAIDVPMEEVPQLWSILNETDPANWPTIDTSAEPFLEVVPYLPTYWASVGDPPLWIGEPAKPASPWLCTSFFGADAEALGVDVTVAPIQLDREPCNEFPCYANLEGLTMPDHPVFPRIVDELEAFLNLLFGSG